MTEKDPITAARRILELDVHARTIERNPSIDEERLTLAPIVAQVVIEQDESRVRLAMHVISNETPEDKLRARIAELESQNVSFRNSQKACEDCDGPTMAEVKVLRALLSEAKEALREFSITKSPDLFEVRRTLARIQEAGL